jgi:hypothetical protein
MALKVEGVVDGGVHAEKPLGGASRFEPLHFVLSLSYRLMRVFSSMGFCLAPAHAGRSVAETLRRSGSIQFAPSHSQILRRPVD